MKKKVLAGILAAAFVFGAVGCGSNENEVKLTGKDTVDLMEGIEEKADDGKVEEPESHSAGQSDATMQATDVNLESFQADTADFSIALLQKNLENGEKNVMVSPVSVLTALAMTANGAEGETLAQMQQVLGKSQNLEQLNQNIKAWSESLTNTKDTALKVANSIWFKDDESRIQVDESFLEKNAAYYNADIYKAAFDESTLKDMNNWVSAKTEGRVKDILDKIPDDAVMYLVNALAFDAEWRWVYYESQVWDGTFYAGNGEEETVPFMHSEEGLFLQDENATGFVKPYKEGYSFVAILPNAGISPQEYVASLSGEKFLQLLEGQKQTTVYASIPKFEAEYEVEMKDILMGLGMPDAFDADKADFSKLGVSAEGNIYLSRVIHKTYISVNEKGTEAGAATVVEATAETAALVEEYYEVYLERPFVYAIVENETNIPLFIGTVDSVEAK